MTEKAEDFWPPHWRHLPDDVKRIALITHHECGFLVGPLRWHVCRKGHRLIQPK